MQSRLPQSERTMRAGLIQIDSMRLESFRPYLLLLATALLLASPVAAKAQSSQDEIHATIMAALLTDPRTATIPPAQLMALVNALSDQAQAQGITAQEIKWRPAVGETFVPASAMNEETCGGPFSALCPFSEAFGFAGRDPSTPAVLFVTAGLLLLIIRRVIKHHRMMLDKQKAAVSPPGVAQ